MKAVDDAPLFLGVPRVAPVVVDHALAREATVVGEVAAPTALRDLRTPVTAALPVRLTDLRGRPAPIRLADLRRVDPEPQPSHAEAA